MINFEDILSDRIKWGQYQLKQFLCLSIFLTIGGFQLYYSVQVLGILKNVPGYTMHRIEFLGTVYFLGQMLGYAFYSIFCDRIGRQKLAILNNGMLALGLLFHTLTTELGFLIPIRFFLGVTLSLNEGICKALVVEFSPLNIRGKITSLLTCMFVFGNILSGIICIIYWDDFDEGDWKEGYMIFTMMAMMSFISSIFILRESARFMLANGQFEKALIEINYMGFMNYGNNFTELTIEEFQQLKTQSQSNVNSVISINSLFASSIIRITILLFLISIMQNLIDKGMIIMIPFLSHDRHLKLYDIPLFSLLELFAPMLACRNRGLGISYFICSISLIFIGFFGEQALLFCIIFQRFSMRLTWTFFFVIILESYQTSIRTLGFGMCMCVGKIAGSMSPFIFLPLYQWNNQLPFFILSILSLISTFIVFLLPIELTQKPLDSYQNKSEIQLSQVNEDQEQDTNFKFQNK